MVHRPPQQARRPERGRPVSRTRFLALASAVVAAAVVVMLVIGGAPRGIAAAAPSTGAPPLADPLLGPAAPPVAQPFRWPEAHLVTLTLASPAPSASQDATLAVVPMPSSSAWPAPSVTPVAQLKPGEKPPTTPPTSKEPEDLKGYTWPLYQGRMTNFFGPRDDGFLVVDGQRIHPGLDTTTFCGDKVRAAHAGVVVAVGRRFAGAVGFGGSLDEFERKIRHRHSLYMQPIVVVVDDGNGYRSMYVHLSQASVRVGDKVRRRMAIGYEGRTGNANGCHVHYELVRMDGPWMRVAGELVKQYGYPAWERERVDPLRVLDLHVKRAGRFVPGILRPKLSESLRPGSSASP